MALIGEDKVIANLNKEIRAIRGRTRQGLAAAAAIVKRESQRRTPVDTGNLKASHYIAALGSAKTPVAEIGATAYYAVYVHEQVENYHKVGQAKFLRDAIHHNKDRIVKAIARRAKVR